LKKMAIPTIKVHSADGTVQTVNADNPLAVTAVAGAASAVPTQVNVTLALANTEYSFLMPNGTQAFEFQARTAADVRFAFATGHVAASVPPYHTLKANDYFSSPPVNMTGRTIFFASGNAGTVVEVVAWS
jgi:hypothetical protein